MTRWLKTTVALLAVARTVASQAPKTSDRTPSAILNGRVLFNNSSVRDGWHVLVMSPDRDLLVAHALTTGEGTNRAGTFSLGPLPTGVPLVLAATTPEYQTFSTVVDIPPLSAGSSSRLVLIDPKNVPGPGKLALPSRLLAARRVQAQMRSSAALKNVRYLEPRELAAELHLAEVSLKQGRAEAGPTPNRSWIQRIARSEERVRLLQFLVSAPTTEIATASGSSSPGELPAFVTFAQLTSSRRMRYQGTMQNQVLQEIDTVFLGATARGVTGVLLTHGIPARETDPDFRYYSGRYTIAERVGDRFRVLREWGDALEVFRVVNWRDTAFLHIGAFATARGRVEVLRDSLFLWTGEALRFVPRPHGAYSAALGGAEVIMLGFFEKGGGSLAFLQYRDALERAGYPTYRGRVGWDASAKLQTFELDPNGDTGVVGSFGYGMFGENDCRKAIDAVHDVIRSAAGPNVALHDNFGCSQLRAAAVIEPIATPPPSRIDNSARERDESFLRARQLVQVHVQAIVDLVGGLPAYLTDPSNGEALKKLEQVRSILRQRIVLQPSSRPLDTALSSSLLLQCRQLVEELRSRNQSLHPDAERVFDELLTRRFSRATTVLEEFRKLLGESESQPSNAPDSRAAATTHDVARPTSSALPPGVDYEMTGRAVRVPGSVFSTMTSGTIAMWVRGKSARTHYNLFAREPQNGDPRFRAQFGGSRPDTVDTFYFMIDGENASRWAPFGTLGDPTSWNHLAMTWDGKNKTLYLNGARVQSYSGSWKIASGGDLVLGSNAINSKETLSGSIRDFVLIPKALSSDEVSALATRRRP